MVWDVYSQAFFHTDEARSWQHAFDFISNLDTSSDYLDIINEEFRERLEMNKFFRQIN